MRERLLCEQVLSKDTEALLYVIFSKKDELVLQLQLHLCHRASIWWEQELSWSPGESLDPPYSVTTGFFDGSREYRRNQNTKPNIQRRECALYLS
jgi:hypothetical protein